MIVLQSSVARSLRKSSESRHEMQGMQGSQVLDIVVGKGELQKAVAEGLDKFIRETQGGKVVLGQLESNTKIIYLVTGAVAGAVAAFILLRLLSKKAAPA